MLLNLFAVRQAKKLARTLEKELADCGVTLAHGQALDTLARLAGRRDWKEVVRSRRPEVLDQQLLSVELEHIRHSADNDYGEEAALLVHTGFSLRYSAREEAPCDYVRVCDPAGREIAYWVSDEWRDDPEGVMGAILGALARGEPLTLSGADSRDAATTSGPVLSSHRNLTAAAQAALEALCSISLNEGDTTSAAHEKVRQSARTARAAAQGLREALRSAQPLREPRIQDVRFTDLSAIVINNVGWSVYYVESEVLGRLHDETRGARDDVDEGEGDDEEVLVRLAHDGNPPYITERELTLETVRGLRWDAAGRCFVDAKGTTYDFIYAQRFADAWAQQA